MNNLRAGLSLDRLVAHRGYPVTAPENTLGALRAALNMGAQFVEFDVQMTTDRVPVVFHDEDLSRITGIDGRIMDLTLDALPQIPGSGNKNQECIPTVTEAANLLQDWPQVLAFVELKPASIQRFGRERVVKNTLDAMQAIKDQCVIISYDLEAVRLARSLGAPAIGWVLKSWNNESYARASELRPNYMFLNHLLIPSPANLLWVGPWRWVMYEIDTLELAQFALSRGVDLLETMHLALLAGITPPQERGKASA